MKESLSVKRSVIAFILIDLFLLISYSSSFAQNYPQENIFSTENRAAFGNYLFYDKDYLRAIHEFRESLKSINNDTLRYKIGISLFNMSRFSEASDNFKSLFFTSKLSQEAKLEFYRAEFFSDDYGNFRLLSEQTNYLPQVYSKEIMKLKQISYLMQNVSLPDSVEFISAFDDNEKEEINNFYLRKKDPPFKNRTKAAIMSAVIPGSGKVYAGEVGDGITTFLLTGLFIYLAVDNFNKDRAPRAWLFTALAAFFYGGGVYGSAAAVDNYNAMIRFNFDNELNLYLNKKQYFLPTPKYLCD